MASLDDVVSLLRKIQDAVARPPLAKTPGKFGYASGAAGTVTPPAGARVIAIDCHSTAGGSVTIFGGSAVTVVAGLAFNLPVPWESLVGDASATIVFAGTDSYFVAWVE